MAKAKKQEKPIEQRLEEALVLYEKTPYELPSNWCWTRVENCFSMKNGYAFRQSDFNKNGKIPVIKIRNLQDGEIVVDDKTDYVLDNFSSEFTISSGDLLVALSGATTGKFGIYKLKEKAYLNQRVGNIGINSNCIVEKYRNYFFEKSSEEILKSAYGGAQPNISWNDIKLFFFPLAPLEEQKRIVEIIEKQFAKLDEARDLIQKSLGSFADRKSAILHKAFTGELTKKWREDNNILFEWKECRLEEVGELVTGSTPDTKKKEYYNGSFPFVKPTDLNQGRNILGAIDTLSNEGKKNARIIRAGATCVCCIGATISKCGFLQVEATTNQQINSVIPFDFMDDLFVYYYCCSDDFKQRLIDRSSATTLPIISKGKMAELKIVVPSKSEQEEIVRILDSIFEKEDKSKELLDMLDKIDEMKKSILARAFRGQLGTSNPTDEPATDLLRKILEYNNV